LDKHSQAQYKLWVELLDLEPWLDKHSRAQYKLWVELLDLEPWLDKLFRALEGLDRDRSGDGFVILAHKVESLFDGLRWMAYRSSG